jgi:hypothetical protein
MDGESVACVPGECTVKVGDFTLRARSGDVDARGPVKLVARPERVVLLPHGADEPAENRLPGMVERTVYVGATLQVMVRLATGAVLQAAIANTGHAVAREQGTPVQVHVPADALRVLGGQAAESAPAPVDPPPEPVRA